MMKRFIVFLLFNFSLCSFSQVDNIGGVVNAYSPVTAIDTCENWLEVADPSVFSVGKKAVLIQMKGASVNLSNTGLFGSIIGYNRCGNYEIIEVASISGSRIYPRYLMERRYFVGGSVQLITLPEYNVANVNAVLTCPSWNGSTGGVLAVKANRLNVNAAIDVSGKGFKGADTLSDSDCYGGGFSPYTGYACAVSDFCGAKKGEGIANIPTAGEYGRGAAANGGGGANDHNAGGGGGGNFGKGGAGGARLNAVSCTGLFPGIGGFAQTYTSSLNAVFMGGGGGAGDGNNGQQTPGANGGGLILIIADTLEGTQVSISARGDSVRHAAVGDGSGGGGAGGGILLSVNHYLYDSLLIDIRGGKGSNNMAGFDPTPNRCFGPGGGGGGGVCWYKGSALPNSRFLTQGGKNGIVAWAGADVSCRFLSNGAQTGDDGGVLSGLTVSEGNRNYVPLILQACCDTFICQGNAARISAVGSGTAPLSYRWSNGASTSEIIVSPVFSTAYGVTLTDGTGCTKDTSIFVTMETISLLLSSAPPSPVLEGQTVTLVSNAGPGIAYSWSPTSGLSDPNSSTPGFTATQDVKYCIYGETPGGCKDTACISIDVTRLVKPESIAIPDAFTPNGDGVNDVFTILYTGNYNQIRMKIFNRDGSIVFESKEFAKGWDGKFNGKDQMAGTYTYFIVLSDDRTELGEKKYKGSLSLIR